MKRKYTIPLIVLAIIIVIGGVSLADNKSTDATVLKIGVIAPLSGDYAGIGENVVKGIKTAQSLYTEKTGKKIDLLVENDSADAAKGLSAYLKLTQVNHVDGLINSFTSTMDAIYEPVTKAGYPVMMEFFQANNVMDDNVFQMTAGNDHSWDRYAMYIKSAGFDESRVVIVHSIDVAQTEFAKRFIAEYKKPVTTIVTSSDKNALRNDAAKIAALKPTLIIFFMPPENGAVLTKNLLPLISTSTQLAYDIQLHTGLSFYQDQLGGDLSKINGAINIMFEADPETPEYKEFVAAFKKLYPNEEPGFIADYGYDTFMTYMEAYDKDNSKWIKNLKATDAKGASGEVKFDENGIRIVPFVVKKVIDGKSQVIDKLPF